MNVTFGLYGQRPSAGLASQEDDEPPFTQPSTSQVQRGLEKVTTAQVDQKVVCCTQVRSGFFFLPHRRLCVPQVAELVQFILVKDHKKIPIRRLGELSNVWIFKSVYKLIFKFNNRMFLFFI